MDQSDKESKLKSAKLMRAMEKLPAEWREKAAKDASAGESLANASENPERPEASTRAPLTPLPTVEREDRVVDLQNVREALRGQRGPLQSVTDLYEAVERERRIEANNDVRRMQEEASLARAERRAQDVLGHCGIPTLFEVRTFDAYETAPNSMQETGLSICHRYVEKLIKMRKNGVKLSPGNILILGQPGVGKTHLGSAMVHRAMEGGLKAVYSSPSGYLKALQRSFDDHTTHEVESLYQQADLLVLDEFTRVVSSSGFFANSIFHLIDSRYEEMRPTVIIGNNRPDEIKRVLGEAIWRRLSGRDVNLTVVNLSPETKDAENTSNAGWRNKS